MPLQKPIANFTGDDDYKIQLSFDGDRHLTPWLKVMGKGAPTAPLVEVVLRRSGQELLGVVATVKQASPSFRRSHPQLVPEFANTTHWPKFLPVKYSFDTQNDVDLERGLYVVFAAGLLVGLAVAISAVWGVGSKLVSFLSEVTGDGPADGKDAVAGSSGWKGGQKAE